MTSSRRPQNVGHGRGGFHRTEQGAVGFSRHVSQHFRERETLDEQEGVYIPKHQRLRRPSPGSAARAVYGVGEPRVPGLQVRIKALARDYETMKPVDISTNTAVIDQL